jgi:hypothetical protein
MRTSDTAPKPLQSLGFIAPRGQCSARHPAPAASWRPEKPMTMPNTTLHRCCIALRISRWLRIDSPACRAAAQSPLRIARARSFEYTIGQAHRAGGRLGRGCCGQMRSRPPHKSGTRCQSVVFLTTGIKLRSPEGAQRPRATSASTSELYRGLLTQQIRDSP